MILICHEQVSLGHKSGLPDCLGRIDQLGKATMMRDAAMVSSL